MRLKKSLVQALIITVGLNHVFIGLAQLLAPEWFWQNIGYFPPFNRHYVGDMGSFQLPLGLALLWATRDPQRHRLLLAYAVAGNLIHAANHVYDDILAGTLFSWQTVILAMVGLAFTLVLWPDLRQSGSRP